jgi:hypothetical protein
LLSISKLTSVLGLGRSQSGNRASNMDCSTSIFSQVLVSDGFRYHLHFVPIGPPIGLGFDVT